MCEREDEQKQKQGWTQEGYKYVYTHTNTIYPMPEQLANRCSRLHIVSTTRTEN